MSGRFALFGGDHYYPLGGWEDFLGVFGSLDEAIAAGVASSWSGSSGHPGSWWHVVEIDSRIPVARGDWRHKDRWLTPGDSDWSWSSAPVRAPLDDS